MGECLVQTNGLVQSSSLRRDFADSLRFSPLYRVGAEAGLLARKFIIGEPDAICLY